jgi:hypothetical protein
LRVPAGALHPTAWLDGFGHQIPAGDVTAEEVPANPNNPNPGGLPNIRIRFTLTSNVPTGTYNGSVYDDQFNLIVANAPLPL